MLLSLANQLFSTYDTFREPTLTHRRFKPAQLAELIEKIPFKQEVVGHSFEQRPIYRIEVGNGPVQVLLWSQMHGDEATATMALVDMLHFFKSQADAFDDFRRTLFQNLTIHIVPMLNPDGAERFQRRTAQGIDMNRDALALQTPEGRLLKQLQQQFQPEFAFNLHDKRTRYSAGKNPRQATLSFLATAYNQAKEWNATRSKAMQLIGLMNATVQPYIPQGVGRWSDEFEPRAFGDLIQQLGSSLILVESGGFKHDREKQFIRKLNYLVLLMGLYGIATKAYENYGMPDYEQIPMNDLHLFDVLIRQAQFEQNGQTFRKDMGIIIEEKNSADSISFTLQSVLEEMGDLHNYWGIEEIDATALKVQSFDDFPEWKAQHGVLETAIELDAPANFVLTAENKPRYFVVNGKVIEATQIHD